MQEVRPTHNPDQGARPEDWHTLDSPLLQDFGDISQRRIFIDRRNGLGHDILSHSLPEHRQIRFPGAPPEQRG